MNRVFILAVVAVLTTAGPAAATTCSQANSECEAKGLTNVVIGAPSDAASEAKGLVNVITNTSNVAAAKLLINVIIIPGTSTGGVIPTSPLTNHR